MSTEPISKGTGEFDSLRAVLAKANERKTGELAGIAADSEVNEL